MRAGLLNELITIITPDSIIDEYGSKCNVWNEVQTVKANVRFKSDMYKETNREMLYTDTLQVKTRMYHDIKQTYRIKYNGILYSIISVYDNKQLQYKELIITRINE